MTTYYFSSLTAIKEGRNTLIRTEEEVKNKGADFVYVHLKDVSFTYEGGETHLFLGGKKVELQNATFILRKLGDEHSNYWLTFYSILQVARGNNIPVFNGETFSSFPHLEDKLFQQTYFSQQFFPVIEPSQYFSTIEQFEKNATRFPILAKPRTGSCGKGVAFFEDIDQVKRYFFKKNISEYIFQRFVENKYDLRVVTSKDGIIGAIKRYRSSGLVNNYSAGGSVEVFELNDTLEKLCVDVCNSVKADHLGVDLIFDEESQQYYLLEVNRFMAFEGFEKSTGINYAEKMIETIL